MDLSAGQRRGLDIFEQVAALTLFTWMVIRLLPGAHESGGLLSVSVLLISEGVVVALLLFRRPTQNISMNVEDWLFAAAGTFLPLMVEKGGATTTGLLGPLLMLIGLITHVGAKFSLFRSFGLVAANRGVKIGGLYAYVRHPMYAGYMLTHVGFLLSAPSLWNLAIYAAVWTLLIARIRAEERILGEDADYRKYARRVKHRIIPGVY